MLIQKSKVMSKSAKSVFVFGIYLAINGLMLLLIPNVLITLLGIESTNEVWIRLCGVLFMAVAIYYILGAMHEIIVIMKATAFIRFTIILFFVSFALLEFVSPNIIIIAIITFSKAFI